MAAMGGSVEEAKRYVRNMKDQSRNQADKDSQKQRFKVYHQANKKKVNKKKLFIPVLNISTAWAERTRGPQRMR